MMIDYANSWLPAIAEAIEEGYLIIDGQNRIIRYNKSVLKAPRPPETQLENQEFPRNAWIFPFAAIANRRAAALTASARLPGDLPHFLSPCKLEQMIRWMWKLLSPQIEEKDAHLSLNLIVPVINYVKVYLENILFNLINNAITYTRTSVIPGSWIETWKEENHTVLVVEDNGIAIDLEKHQEQLFRYKGMFHRGYGSNGVDLFKIRNRIRTLGNNIEVTGDSGMGSSFYVYFNNRVHTLQQDE